jgi:hypothetical protein
VGTGETDMRVTRERRGREVDRVDPRSDQPGPGAHNAYAGGRDWGGYLDDVGLSREGSPFRIPANGRKRRRSRIEWIWCSLDGIGSPLT